MASGTGTNKATNVSTGKPKVGGAIYYAPIGSTAPTDAKTDLDAAFVCLGYVSEDGITNTNSPESEDIKAWGGATVATVQSEKTDTFQFTLLESMSDAVLKYIYGASNVSGAITEEGGLAIKANSDDATEYMLVIDMILKGNVRRRFYLPDSKLTELGDISYKDSEAIGYQVTVTAFPDSSDVTHYEWIDGTTTA